MIRLKNPDVVNPYRLGLGEIVRRLSWDIQLESWRSRRRVGRWRNTHVGERCVILCNGPSLLQTDFSSLGSVFTFGMNKINLLFEKTDFRPSCIVAVNAHVIQQNAEFYNATDIPLFLSRAGVGLVASRPNVAFLHTSGRGFARDCSVSVSEGATVTYVALQLAYHMGFQAATLVGCDHNFVAVGQPHHLATAGEHDANHFHPKYFADGAKWQYPDLLESEVAYRRARNSFEHDGRRVFNSTIGSKLDLFPRLPLSEFLNMDMGELMSTQGEPGNLSATSQ